jgi:TolB-like protein
MQIWSAEIKELETLYTSIKEQFSELRKELVQLIETKDANVVLLYSRRCLEVIITDLCECELKRPRKTEPLKGIIDKLYHEEKIPSHIITSMQNLNSLSTYGAHPKEFEPEQVRPVLINLITIIKWYLKYKDAQTITKPKAEGVTDETKVQDNSTKRIKKTKKKLILLISGLALIVAIIIVALYIFDIIGGEERIKELEKSIAVLPFHNDSPDEENQYFINGTMEAILDNLCKIEDLRVVSRTSVEQYRNSPKSIPEIARELNVNYILEGSGQKYGDNIRLTVQLLDAEIDKHIWSSPYNREIKDIFSIQSEIAQLIANELKAIISPEEKQLIEKKPTLDLTAYDFYQRGKEEFWKYQLKGDSMALESAEHLYYKALEYDSAFAQAWVGLAWVYWNKYYWSEFFSESFMDSALILSDIALTYDDQLSEAYTLKGRYYSQSGKPEKALEEFDKAIKFNPNDWMPYFYKAGFSGFDDLIRVLENAHKAVSLHRGPQLPQILSTIYWAYRNAGFPEKSKYYADKILELNGDSAEYYSFLAGLEKDLSNYEKEIEFLLKEYAIDLSSLLSFGECYMNLGQYEKSLEYYKKYIEQMETRGGIELWNMQRIGYAYWINGYKNEADYYFKKQIEYSSNEIQLGRFRSEQYFTYYDLAGVYAFLGEKDKAYENLRIFNQKKIMYKWMVQLIKKDPLFDSIRDEPEFQQIVSDVEAKYQAEHERVRKWLEEREEL